MANSAVFLCSAFLQVNYQGLAGNYPAITQRSGELPVIYLTANNTKSRTRQELHNRTSWGTCKWKKNAVTAARVQGSGQGCQPQMGTRMSPGSALSLHVELFPARVDLVHRNVKGWGPHGSVTNWPGGSPGLWHRGESSSPCSWRGIGLRDGGKAVSGLAAEPGLTPCSSPRPTSACIRGTEETKGPDLSHCFFASSRFHPCHPLLSHG